jgi:hypothetical protein
MAGELSKLSGEGRIGLKALAARLIAAAGGPQKAELVTRVRQPALSSYADSDHPDAAERVMPLDVAAELTLDTAGRVGPLVARHFAALTGHAVVALPKGIAGEPHLSLAQAVRETGEALSAFAEAAADGRFDSAEAEVIAREVDEAVERLLALKAVAELASEDDPAPPANPAPVYAMPLVRTTRKTT